MDEWRRKRRRAVEEARNGSLQLSRGGALDVANKPVVGGQRASDDKFREYKQPNELLSGSFKFPYLLSPPTADLPIRGGARRVRRRGGGGGGRSLSCARRPRPQLLSRDTIGHASFFDDLHEAEWSEGQLLEYRLDK